jgi:signal transduction histidine kinase
MYAFDMDKKLVVWNKEAERVTGFAREELSDYQGVLHKLFPNPIYRESRFESFEHAPPGRRDWEWEVSCKNGQVRTIAWYMNSERVPIPGWKYWGIGIDVTEHRLLERQLIEVSHSEQRRIGQELHDRLGQQLTGIAFISQYLASDLKEHKLEQSNQAVQLVNLVGDAIEQTRTLARSLVATTLASEGLIPALTDFAQETSDVFGIDCRFICEESVSLSDPSSVEHVYRIAKEAVTNAVKHADPKCITISLWLDNNWATLSIVDDGKGFDADQRGAGMGSSIMHYRAHHLGAELAVDSKVGEGTRISCTFDVERLTNSFEWSI